ARGRGANSPLMLCERKYLEAWRLAETQPDLAAEKLRDVIALYPIESLSPVEDGGVDSPERRRALCIELARHQLAELEERIAHWHNTDLKELEGRLEAPRQLHREDPQQAIGICHSLVRQFGDEPWAAPVVERARQAI